VSLLRSRPRKSTSGFLALIQPPIGNGFSSLGLKLLWLAQASINALFWVYSGFSRSPDIQRRPGYRR
jgi:hypothetical protein